MTSRTHSTSSFTRGSQLFMHTLRMMSQGAKAVIFGSCLMVLGWIWFRGSRYLDWTDVYYWVFERWATVKLDIGAFFYHPTEITIEVYDLGLGLTRKLTAIGFKDRIWSGPIGEHLMDFWDWFSAQALLESLLVFVFGFLLISGFFSWSGWQKGQKKHIRGMKIATIFQLKKLMRKQKLLGPLNLGGVPLVKDQETSHILIAGTTGSGKTNALHHLLPQIRHQKAVIVDVTGELTRQYFDPKKDILLSPGHEQSAYWDMWSDTRNNFEYRGLAEAFVGEGSKHDPFWSQAASECFAAALEKLKTTRSISELTRVLTKDSLEEFCKFFEGTSAAAYADPKGERTTVSIRSTLVTKIQSLEIMAKESKGESFSFRDWMKQEENPGWLFLTTRPDQREILCPLISAQLGVALKALMQLPPNDERRCWFVIDELPALNKTPALLTAATEGRKYGACLVAGLQDMAQLRTKYSPDEADTLLNQLNTKVFFRFTDTKNATMVSRMLGEREEMTMKEGLSFGANTMRDGVNMNESTTKEAVVMSTEIASLRNLECFVRLPEDLPIVKHQMKWVGDKSQSKKGR